jgi:hypothetical protein
MRRENRNCGQWQNIALSTACSLALLLVFAGNAQAVLYRWVDSNGQVHYGDTLPPTYQKSGASELNKQGLVVKRTASEAERRQAAEKKVEQDRRQREADERTRLDRALTSTYTTEAEIDLARDRALEHHRLAINGAETRAKAVNANLKELKDRADRIMKSGKTLPPSLQAQLSQAEKERLELIRTVLQNEEAMVKVHGKYDADKQRFRELKVKTP